MSFVVFVLSFYGKSLNIVFLQTELLVISSLEAYGSICVFTSCDKTCPPSHLQP